MTIHPSLIEGYLERTRWFGGKGRPYAVTGIEEVGEHVREGLTVRVLLVQVSYSDSLGGTERYQVPISIYREPQDRIAYALIGTIDGDEVRYGYDAVHDRVAMAVWRDAFAAAVSSVDDNSRGGSDVEATHVTDALRAVFAEDARPPLGEDDAPVLLTAEQSNSSVRFGETSILKVFRKVEAGIHPDIEMHRLLTDAGCESVAELFGWQDVTRDGETIALGMLQHFLRTATDGFDLALASVRTLVADRDTPVEQSGGDFASEATHLGEAIALVHRVIADTLPAETLGREAAEAIARKMRRRLDDAVIAVPELERFADDLRDLFGQVAELDAIEVQRIHGDLHLGQALRTSSGWKIVDFEGEPLKSLVERRSPDSVWRDIAGLLRSFDYAPAVARVASGAGDGADDRARTRDWAARAGEHLVRGYLSDRDDPVLGHEDALLLRAYLADKAVYEAVYEARNRPTWVTIPLGAIQRMTGA